MQELTPTPTDAYPRAPGAGKTNGAWWSDPAIISRALMAFAVVIGVLSLVGWLASVPQLRALGSPDRAAMNPMTAACFVALGSAMWLIATDEVRRGREIASVLAILVVVVGVGRLYALLTGDGPGPDQLL